jgi:hypothetical protein
MNGYAFDNGPNKIARFNFIFSFLNFFDRPHLTIRNVMKGRDDTGGPGLSDIG